MVASACRRGLQKIVLASNAQQQGGGDGDGKQQGGGAQGGGAASSRRDGPHSAGGADSGKSSLGSSSVPHSQNRSVALVWAGSRRPHSYSAKESPLRPALSAGSVPAPGSDGRGSSGGATGGAGAGAGPPSAGATSSARVATPGPAAAAGRRSPLQHVVSFADHPQAYAVPWQQQPQQQSGAPAAPFGLRSCASVSSSPSSSSSGAPAQQLLGSGAPPSPALDFAPLARSPARGGTSPASFSLVLSPQGAAPPGYAVPQLTTRRSHGGGAERGARTGLPPLPPGSPANAAPAPASASASALQGDSGPVPPDYAGDVHLLPHSGPSTHQLVSPARVAPPPHLQQQQQQQRHHGASSSAAASPRYLRPLPQHLDESGSLGSPQAVQSEPLATFRAASLSLQGGADRSAGHALDSPRQSSEVQHFLLPEGPPTKPHSAAARLMSAATAAAHHGTPQHARGGAAGSRAAAPHWPLAPQDPQQRFDLAPPPGVQPTAHEGGGRGGAAGGQHALRQPPPPQQQPPGVSLGQLSSAPHSPAATSEGSSMQVRSRKGSQQSRPALLALAAR